MDAGSYTPANLPGIDIASRKAKPLGFGRRTIACATDSRETHTLRLSKVQYLLNYRINIFRARKLLGRGKIQIEEHNLVVNC